MPYRTAVALNDLDAGARVASHYAKLVTDAPVAEEPLDVLLVEDDDFDAYLIEGYLNASPRVGRVIRASNGEEAFEMIFEGQADPDLAIIDLQMPRISGLELMDRFKALGAQFPYFALSSSNSGADMLRAHKHGSSFFLTKAQLPEQLAKQIETALKQF